MTIFDLFKKRRNCRAAGRQPYNSFSFLIFDVYVIPSEARDLFLLTHLVVIPSEARDLFLLTHLVVIPRSETSEWHGKWKMQNGKWKMKTPTISRQRGLKLIFNFLLWLLYIKRTAGLNGH